MLTRVESTRRTRDMASKFILQKYNSQFVSVYINPVMSGVGCEGIRLIIRAALPLTSRTDRRITSEKVTPRLSS